MTFVDLEPSAQRMSRLVSGVGGQQLGAPTPCHDYTLGALLDHIGRLTVAFTAAATKTPAAESESPVGDASRLADAWQARIPRDLVGLTEAWRDPAARTGMTRAGGIDLPGEVAGVVALEELVIHGWDLARATGQPYECDDATLDVVRGFVSQFAGDDQEELRGSAYRARVAVADTSTPLDRVVALSGRDPAWSPR